MTTTRLSRFRAACVLMTVVAWSTGIASHVQGASIPAVSLATDNNSPFAATFSVGWEFTTLVPITITDLGKFDIGTTDDSDIGIYAAGGALLANTTVLATDPSQAHGLVSARYRAITPLVLAPGTYVVFGQTRNSEFIETSLTTVFGPGISWNKGVALDFNSAFAALPASAPASWPIENSTPSRYFGPTFLYTIPEPATGMLGAFCGLGLAVYGCRCRGRRPTA